MLTHTASLPIIAMRLMYCFRVAAGPLRPNSMGRVQGRVPFSAERIGCLVLNDRFVQTPELATLSFAQRGHVELHMAKTVPH